MTSNRFAAICHLCGGTVPAWAGAYVYVWTDQVIRHRSGQCPGVRAELVAHPMTDVTGRAQTGWDIGELVMHRGELLVVEQTYIAHDAVEGRPVRVHGAALRAPSRWELARIEEAAA